MDALSAICERLHVQPPDLFVYQLDGSRYGFAEVKCPRDSLSHGQILSHGRITRELNLPVEIVIVNIE